MVRSAGHGARTSAPRRRRPAWCCDLIRGKNVNQALATLQFTRKTRRARHRQGAAVGGRQRAAEGRLRRRRRAAVRLGVLRRTRARRRSACVRPRWAARSASSSGRRTSRCAVTERPMKIARGRPRARRAKARSAREEGRSEGARSAPSDARRRLVGQKVHPYGFRLGFNKTWRSRWSRDTRLREAAARGPRAARRPEEALPARRRLEDRDRARGQQAEDRHPHLAPGHHHRPQGHRGRQAEAGDPEADQAARSSSTSRRSRSPSSTRS